MYLKHNRIIIFLSVLTFVFYFASQETLGGEKTFKKNAIKKPPDNAKVCPRCKREFSVDFLFCPFDRTSLKIQAANVTTKTLRALQGIETYSNTIGMEFVHLPPGTFMMGSALDDPSRRDDETLHGVTLTKGIYIQTTEVTQKQWKAVMGNILFDNNPSHFKDWGDDCPADSISWNDTHIFILKLNKMEGTDKYRLPTEAEWEYACRAGSVTAFANGDISEFRCDLDPILDAMGWYCGNAKKTTHPQLHRRRPTLGAYMTCTVIC
jgi:formylglycine-generating enzyme required for sulfatase activity